MVQWLTLRTSTAGGTGSTPGWGTKIPLAVCCSQKKKKLAEPLLVTGIVPGIGDPDELDKV